MIVPKGVSTETKKAWRRIRMAWYTDRSTKLSKPPIWTVFQVGNRPYKCRQVEFNRVQVRYANGNGPSQFVKGNIPEKVELLELQEALQLLDVEVILGS